MRRGCGGRSCAACTAHVSAVGVKIGAGAQFPKHGCVWSVNLPCSLAHFFQGEEVFMSAHAIQPLVDIGLNRGQDDLTISVMLNLLVGLITDANRTHAPLTGPGRLFPLLQPDRKSTRLNSSH